jgi:capsular polysaccharide biosynthesis protein
MTVDQQLSAVANAEIIWCPLGAASSISVMAPDDCVVIEMLGDKSVFGAYNSILAARCLGQSYARVHGQRVYLADNTRKEGIYADFKIDINDCEELLNLIENGLTQARSGVL